MSDRALFYRVEIDACDEPADEFVKVPVVGVLDQSGEEIVRVGDRLSLSLLEALDLAQALRDAVAFTAESVAYP
ncbi:MAG: hypothetical protein KJ792_06600 [Actinobacteria bacterium]|nr:hypothetical protein [Actinomycetota bacterium]MCG2802890.1 hypothetical protein [Cellulomonas sp.]